MRIFISWSGDRSHKVALMFRDMLPLILQYLVPYVSSEDINKGARWSTEIGTELATADFGIVCITKENLGAPWINFEAGALSKSLDKSRVFPFLFDLNRSDVTDGPITQFQSTINEKDDFLKLLKSINASCTAAAMDDSKIESVIDVWWPKIASRLELIGALKPNSGETKLDESDASGPIADDHATKISMILDLLIQQSRLLNSPDELFPASWYRRVARVSGIDMQNPAIRDLVSAYVRLDDILDSNPDRKPISFEELDSIRQHMMRPIKYITRGRPSAGNPFSSFLASTANFDAEDPSTTAPSKPLDATVLKVQAAEIQRMMEELISASDPKPPTPPAPIS
jgi:hypothetical protein